ncbi:MAG: helix-turn-helix domain-containing protein [Syntrophorhabdaceae bacterium]|nr:helix-turn-helix domain-containing protein [Syntrophorhabdaceae bacterium]
MMKTLRQIRKEHVLQILDHTNWDLKKASEMLKVSESFLRKEIRKIGQTETPEHTSKINK